MSSPASVQKPQSRLRTGCNTCRKRHIKCDENHPICHQCKKSKRCCNYSLRLIWEEESVLLGKRHGRTGAWTKHAKSLLVPNERKSKDGYAVVKYSATPYQAFLNTTTDHMKLYYQYFTNGDIVQRSSSSVNRDNWWVFSNDLSDNTLSFTYRVPRLPQFDRLYTSLSFFPSTPEKAETEGILLHYFESVVCNDAAHFRQDDGKDPILYMLLRASDSRAMFLGVMMSSANFLKRSNRTFGMVALHYRHIVLRFLINLLENSRDPTEIIMLATMLCSSEISDRCHSTWATHFIAYRYVLEQPPKSDYLYNIGCRYFACHLVIAKTTFYIEDDDPSTPSSQSWTSTERLALGMPKQTLHDIDSYSGLSNSLLLLINDIVDTRRYCFRATAEDEVLLISKILQLKQNLLDLQQNMPAWTKATDQELGMYLQHTAEANRLAALILLHESFAPPSFSGTPSQGLTKLPWNFNDSSIFNKREKREHIKEVLRLIEKILSRAQITVSWPLWSLFIAGCCTREDEDIIEVIKLFEIAQQKSTSPNIAPAFKIVQAVWQQRELRADDEVSTRTLRRKKQRLELQQTHAKKGSQRFGMCYEWEWVIDKLGCKISLA